MIATEKDYSQYGEQIHILAHTPYLGHFLEIGAWHPTALSNTRALVERGWTGVMVEPSPEPFLSLLKEYGEYPKVKLICAAVGNDKYGLVKMHATADALSTTEEDSFKKWEKSGGFYGSFLAVQIPLRVLLSEAFDFVSIDTEGTSHALFADLLASGARPKCIVVEHDGHAATMMAGAERCGYRFVADNGTNLIVTLA